MDKNGIHTLLVQGKSITKSYPKGEQIHPNATTMTPNSISMTSNPTTMTSRSRRETLIDGDSQQVSDELSDLDEKSYHLNKLLDCIGYSNHMVNIRRAIYREMHEPHNVEISDVKRTSGKGQKRKMKYITCGSKGEGLSKPLESDIDCIGMLKSFVCVRDDVTTQRTQSPHLTPPTPPQAPPYTPILYQSDSHPEYCLLELRGFIGNDLTGQVAIANQGKQYLSSAKFRALLIETGSLSGIASYNSGPAITYHGDIVISDVVPTYESDCRDILDKWASRMSRYDWPPQTLLERILNMNGNIVPVGCPGSRTKDLEWRYCFNEIELVLVDSLNDTQLKLYKTLKDINKDILQKHGFTLSSYIMKNIVFWIADKHSQSEFHPGNLLKWVVACLQLLRQFISEEAIPYYMIPERNLLIEKVPEDNRCALGEFLDELIPTVTDKLFECERLKKYANLSSEDLEVFKKKRDNFEEEFLFSRFTDYSDSKGHEKLVKGDLDSFENVKKTVVTQLESSENSKKMSKNRVFQDILYGWPSEIQQEIETLNEDENYDAILKMLVG